MNILFMIAFALVTISIKAQFVLTHSFNSPVSGDVHNAAPWDSTIALSRSTGLNQVWNYGSIAHAGGALTNMTYALPSAVPGISSAFPSANLIGYSVPMTSPHSYNVYNISAYADTLLGGYCAAMVPPSCAFSPALNMYSYPFGYGNSSSFNSTSTLGTGPNQNQTSVTGTCSATGAGTLILPGGITLNNCLQVKTVLTEVMTLAGSSSTISYVIYDYFSSTQKFPVLTISNSTTKTGPGTPVLASKIVVNTAAVPVAIIENTINNKNISIYPNPLNDVLNLKVEGGLQNARYLISDVNGKEVGESLLNGMGPASVNISDLKPGIYFVKVIADQFEAMKRVIISR